jgi:hypothetical protein
MTKTQTNFLACLMLSGCWLIAPAPGDPPCAEVGCGADAGLSDVADASADGGLERLDAGPSERPADGGPDAADTSDGGWIRRTVCEVATCTYQFPEADGGSVFGLCGDAGMGPGCQCARAPDGGAYHPMCTGGCNPDGGLLCIELNCWSASCFEGSSGGTRCVRSGVCE